MSSYEKFAESYMWNWNIPNVKVIPKHYNEQRNIVQYISKFEWVQRLGNMTTDKEYFFSYPSSL